MRGQIRSFIFGFTLCLAALCIVAGLCVVADGALGAMSAGQDEALLDALGGGLAISDELTQGLREAAARLIKAAEFASPPLVNLVRVAVSLASRSLTGPR